MLGRERKSVSWMSDEDIKAEIEDGFLATNQESRPPTYIQGRLMGGECYCTIAKFSADDLFTNFMRARRTQMVVKWDDQIGEPDFENWRDVSVKLDPWEFPIADMCRAAEFYDELDPYRGSSFSTVRKTRLGIYC